MKTLSQVSDFVDTIDDHRQEKRIKHRLAFNPNTFGEMADNLMEEVNQGVGKVRTKVFDVEDIIQYFGIKTQKILTPEQTFQRILPVANDILNVKTEWLKQSGSINKIVKTLNNPDTQSSTRSEKDLYGKSYEMFLKAARGGFDTDRLAMHLFREFKQSIAATGQRAKQIAII